MSIRRDPLAAAAEAIYSIEQRCRQLKPSMGQTDRHGSNNGHGSSKGLHEPSASNEEDTALVCTVGSISVWPGADNVIPGSANFSVDTR